MVHANPDADVILRSTETRVRLDKDGEHRCRSRRIVKERCSTRLNGGGNQTSARRTSSSTLRADQCDAVVFYLRWASKLFAAGQADLSLRRSGSSDTEHMEKTKIWNVRLG